ncbi:DUF1003 domain-containing protein [Aporhodopirellula aestuarii]|uniref:DUF1003 domain-containing protein n=1 Tax=Aporhodopirellula aestuarii TaxID=2950107 RepID=A0ABT0U0G6_9BACT|nr:DUF1003 domain-containing protein [Aporhodopirellula aestuarii]MCM2370241.1 DUF1003 domain-containing protein [Aporhodopirellula aestuarii]
MHNHQKIVCSVCHKSFSLSELIPARFVRPLIAERIASEHPEWRADSYICQNDLNRYRSLYVQDVLEQERGELTSLEKEVIDSLREHDILTQNLNDEVDDRATVGQRLADKVASFGGSWTFILFFAGVLVIWITINSLAMLGRPFDPFPFILLNLVLSCLAALQAPVIMMSQNRQETKDRLRAENDYRINLKAELEIRHLHSKMDLLLTHQWQRLLEIQQVQTDLLEEMSNKR